MAIQADARLAIDALAQALQERGVTANEEYVAEITSGRREAIAAAAADAEGALEQGEMPLKGKSIVHEINRVFGDNTILVKENGGQDLWAYYWPYYQVLDPGCCVPPAEQTAMGYGVVGAMAAKLARPDRQVVCTTGDGAFQMQFHELGHGGAGGVGRHLGRPRRQRVRLGAVDPEADRGSDRRHPIRSRDRSRGERQSGRHRGHPRRGSVWSASRAGDG